MLVSIIIPIYKVEPYIVRCIESVLHQTYQEIEIILVDDGSPDNCPKICDEYSKKDKRILVIHQENRGLPEARRSGYLASTGDYIFFVDSDDYITSDCIEILVRHAINSQVDIVVAGIYNVEDKELISIPRAKPGYYNKERINDLLKTNFLYDINTFTASYPLYAWGKLIRKSLLEGYFEVSTQFRYWEDIPSTFFLMKKTQSLEIIREKIYYYVIHSNQITKKPLEHIWHYYVDVWNYLYLNDKDHYLKVQLPQRIWWTILFSLNNIVKQKLGYNYFKKIFKLTRETEIVTKNIKEKEKLNIEGLTNNILYILYLRNCYAFFYILCKYNIFVLMTNVLKK